MQTGTPPDSLTASTNQSQDESRSPDGDGPSMSSDTRGVCAVRPADKAGIVPAVDAASGEALRAGSEPADSHTLPADAPSTTPQETYWWNPVTIPAGRKSLDVSGPDRDGDVLIEIDNDRETIGLYLKAADAMQLSAELQRRAAPSTTPQEPHFEALIDRAGDWQSRTFDYEVGGFGLTKRETEARDIIADLMLALAHSVPIELAAPSPTERADPPFDAEQNAILRMFTAYQELKALGWNDAIYCPKDGTHFLSIEPGSTGIHDTNYEGEWPKGCWWIFDGDMWPSRPCLFKLKSGEAVSALPAEKVKKK